MKIAATAANAAQLVIILAVLFIGGLDLGVLVIFLLFVLMAVPFVNFLALFLANRPALESDAKDTAENGLIKREAMRVSYGETDCPVMKTGGTAFAVLDLSEGGVRVRASQSTPFKRKVKGEIQLISGDRIGFKATLLRRDEGEAVFQFTDPLGTALIMQEKKAMADGNAG